MENGSKNKEINVIHVWYGSVNGATSDSRSPMKNRPCRCANIEM